MNAKKYYYILLFLTVLATCITQKFDHPYERPIIGDAKAYYAYLPAIFIYQDLSYSFIDEVEKTYYNNDPNLYKEFKTQQPNGTIVNKTFPGATLFYAPFFGIAAGVSYVIGLPVDGYSVLFQWSIVVANFFFLFWAIFLLDRFLNAKKYSILSRATAVFAVVLGSNVYNYLVYDNSVTHLFGFFGFCALIYTIHSWLEMRSKSMLGNALILIAILLITRPTNALMLFALPILFELKEMWQSLITVFKERKLPILKILLAGLILFTPLLLWKIQSGNWLVYSYGNEGFDFSNPHIIDFLFSYQQGWIFWSPIVGLLLVGGLIYWWSENKLKSVLVVLYLFGLVFIFSSWWIWTYGTGVGQRTMIDYYPLVIIGFAGFITKFKKSKWFILPVFFLLIFLNILQTYQFSKGILRGGGTTKELYWKNFLSIHKDPFEIELNDSLQLVDELKVGNKEVLDASRNSSSLIELQSLQGGEVLILEANMSSTGNPKVNIVLSKLDGSYYESFDPSDKINEDLTICRYKVTLDSSVKPPLRCYIWNLDDQNKVNVDYLKVKIYR